MKNIVMRVMLVAMMIVLAGALMNGSAWAEVVPGAGIAGSAHDFTSANPNTTYQSLSDEICNVCHTPHNAKAAQLVPLWNHKGTTTATFALYVSPTLTMNATVGQPSDISKACLSCHDGTVAVDAFGDAAGTTSIPTGDDHLIGPSLSNDHPISFTYDSALATADGELVTPAGATKVDAAGVVPLFDSKVECASCHDVHNTAAQADELLVIDNDGSALCLTCHDK